MIETRRATGLSNDPLTCGLLHLLDVRYAAGIEPGVIRSDISSILAHTDHAGHLAVDADAGHRRLVDLGRFHALADRAANRIELRLGIFLDHAKPRSV